VGKSESGERGFNWIEAWQAHNIRSRQEEDRSRTTGEVGEGEGGEEGGVAAWLRENDEGPTGFVP
jgi:hypothetical protein